MNDIIQVQATPLENMPVMNMTQAKERMKQLTEFVSGCMKDGTDYGVIPGAGQKKVLLKPGAEKLCTLFGLRVEDPEILTEVEDWTGKDHGGEPFFYYKIRQRLSRCGETIASQIASCNSWETKYRYRKGERVCPQCSQPAIIKGKAEFGGGWICFAKKGGCGAKFKNGDKAIEGQQTARVINADVADVVNTILKMSEKRALIAATLVAVNASEFFTQDLEDASDDTPVAAESPPQDIPISEKQVAEITAEAGKRGVKIARILQDYERATTLEQLTQAEYTEVIENLRATPIPAKKESTKEKPKQDFQPSEVRDPLLVDIEKRGKTAIGCAKWLGITDDKLTNLAEEDVVKLFTKEQREKLSAKLTPKSTRKTPKEETASDLDPTTGEELGDWLKIEDARLVKDGLIHRGQLWNHVVNFGAEQDYPPDMVTWSEEQMKTAIAVARNFSKECRHAKAG